MCVFNTCFFTYVIPSACQPEWEVFEDTYAKKWYSVGVKGSAHAYHITSRQKQLIYPTPCGSLCFGKCGFICQAFAVSTTESYATPPVHER